MKRFLSSCVFFLILAFVLISVYKVLSWKDTSDPYISVTEQLSNTGDDLIDLAFVGSSHIFFNVDPACLWNEAGISSFDLSISMMDKVSSEYYLRKLFKTQSPSVVCLELYALQYDLHDFSTYEYCNYLSMDLSPASIQAVLDYQPDDGVMNYILRWPIVHTRYRELQSFDFIQYPFSVFGRGHNYRFDANTIEQDPKAVSTSRVTELSPANKEWLDTMIDLCAEHGSQLCTIITPMIVTEEQQAIYNGAKQYLASRGVECLDLNQSIEEIGIDYTSDFIDAGHMNAWGSKKLTSYLLKELTSRYTFADHREDSRYALWDENSKYDAYQWALYSFQQVSEDDLDGTLKALADCNGMTLIVSCPPGYNKKDSDWFNLFAALGPTPDQITTGGQWILRDGQVLAYIPAHDGAIATVDLNEADTVTIKATETTIFNGTELESYPGTFTLTVYDDYEHEIVAERYYP